MKSTIAGATVFLSVAILSCSKTSSSSTAAAAKVYPAGAAVSATIPTGDNVVPISVGCGYVNEPCVSVTICTPGSTTQCQTINNVLLDTGSYGLRLFSQVVSVPLTNETNGSGKTFAECISYADGSSQWGPVVQADVTMGGQTAPTVPIQIIQSTFANVPSGCTNLDTSPDKAQFNGILGIGLFTEDCGSPCTTQAGMDVYFVCDTSGTCTSTIIPLAKQVSNPIAKLSANYKNGVILDLPAVGSIGAVGATGAMILGIGTVANNTPSTPPTVFPADSNGNFITTFAGHSYPQSFIDSGSNGLFFPTSTISECVGGSDFYCPPSPQNLSAVQIGSSSSPQKSVAFIIGDAGDFLAANNPNIVFNNLGGYFGGAFDWGLPFFLGRTVYVGLSGASSSLATGPYWAY